MIPIDGQPILTGADMCAAEAASIAQGATIETLMARAGAAVAQAVARLSSEGEILILCGPGNNGGDGYVAAAALRASGHRVRVAASVAPSAPAAIGARAIWGGAVEPLATAAPAPIVVDSLFGTGISRALDPGIVDALFRLRSAARLTVAVDLPSGVGTDDGALLQPASSCDLTLALGAVKPAHVLQPAAAACGAVRLLDIGVSASSDARVLAAPVLAPPAADAHKYSRGMVAIVAGAMPGAVALAAISAARGGAGYVLLLGGATDRLPHAIVRRRYEAAALDDPRIGAVVIGPGLGRDDRAQARFDDALARRHPLVIDGGALRLIDADRLARRSAPTILTPHAGEFDALFGTAAVGRIERARKAAALTGATIILKGADTVIAAPDGRVRVATGASAWLSTAGTGDVLAGLLAARLAGGAAPFEAAGEAVWLHARAAQLAGAAFIADDLAAQVTAAIASCR